MCVLSPRCVLSMCTMVHLASSLPVRKTQLINCGLNQINGNQLEISQLNQWKSIGNFTEESEILWICRNILEESDNLFKLKIVVLPMLLTLIKLLVKLILLVYLVVLLLPLLVMKVMVLVLCVVIMVPQLVLMLELGSYLYVSVT